VLVLLKSITAWRIPGVYCGADESFAALEINPFPPNLFPTSCAAAVLHQTHEVFSSIRSVRVPDTRANAKIASETVRPRRR